MAGAITVTEPFGSVTDVVKPTINEKITDAARNFTIQSPSSVADSPPPEKYHALILDSGAIIKQTSFTQLHHSATNFYTVPAVMNEIRDARSRQHLEEFQMRLAALGDTCYGGSRRLEVRVPGAQAIAIVSEFARKTGDYPQLSGVDLQILALLYELEVESCNRFGNQMGYVRSEPKRVLGVYVKPLNGDEARCVDGGVQKRGDDANEGATILTEEKMSYEPASNIQSFFEGNDNGIINAANVEYDFEDDSIEYDDDEIEDGGDDEKRDDFMQENPHNAAEAMATQPKKSSWAMVVCPTASNNFALNSSVEPVMLDSKTKTHVIDINKGFIPEIHAAVSREKERKGQFDDASESSDEYDDDEARAIEIANADSDEEITDEECDAFVLEPHEADYYKKLREGKMLENKQKQDKLMEEPEKQKASSTSTFNQTKIENTQGMESDFPSLATTLSVPYNGSEDEHKTDELHFGGDNDSAYVSWEEAEEERKKKALQPMVNGKVLPNKTIYNSFRKYDNMISANGASASFKKESSPLKKNFVSSTDCLGEINSVESNHTTSRIGHNNHDSHKSRIIGTGGVSTANAAPTEMTADDDDGEGWITSSRDIQDIRTTGSLHQPPNKSQISHLMKNIGPPISQRAACATTDFAMQNVILQMNLELLTIDGVRVRRLKTWVTRCGACFTIYGFNDDKKASIGGRLFCDKCGCNALQRIAASVDKNSGRLKLHLKKNYQYNVRGTKFSLPKAGKGNKYQGDLLLAEDQLMYGAWAQKVRKGKPKSLSESMFGNDLASDLGCNTDLSKRDDIKVGFGRKNPNSTKFGRERRGKKKKNIQDKACGLRRY